MRDSLGERGEGGGREGGDIAVVEAGRWKRKRRGALFSPSSFSS